MVLKFFSTNNKKISISQPYEELQDRNSELKLITSKAISSRHIGTRTAILELWMPSWIYLYMSHLFEELQDLNLGFISISIS